MCDDGGVAVHLEPRGLGGPELVRRQRGEQTVAVGNGEVVEVSVVPRGGHGAANIAPGGVEAEGRGEGNGDVGAVEADAGHADPAEGEEHLEKDESKVAARGVTGDDDLVGWDGLVRSTGGRR